MKKQLKNKKVLIALIGVCIVLAAALSVFIYYKTGLKAVSSRETPTSFQVQPGETSEAVLDKLQTQELIRNKTVAKLYMKFHGLSDIKAGNFKLDARWDTPKILETLNDSKQANADDIKITFKEGRCLSEHADKKIFISKQGYSECAVQGEARGISVSGNLQLP